jgi:hypothetical protein
VHEWWVVTESPFSLGPIYRLRQQLAFERVEIGDHRPAEPEPVELFEVAAWSVDDLDDSDEVTALLAGKHQVASGHSL